MRVIARAPTRVPHVPPAPERPARRGPVLPFPTRAMAHRHAKFSAAAHTRCASRTRHWRSRDKLCLCGFDAPFGPRWRFNAPPDGREEDNSGRAASAICAPQRHAPMAIPARVPAAKQRAKKSASRRTEKIFLDESMHCNQKADSIKLRALVKRASHRFRFRRDRARARLPARPHSTTASRPARRCARTCERARGREFVAGFFDDSVRAAVVQRCAGARAMVSLCSEKSVAKKNGGRAPVDAHRHAKIAPRCARKTRF